MLLKTLMAKSGVTTIKVKSEITYEEKLLLYFWKKNLEIKQQLEPPCLAFQEEQQYN